MSAEHFKSLNGIELVCRDFTDSRGLAYFYFMMMPWKQTMPPPSLKDHRRIVTKVFDRRGLANMLPKLEADCAPILS